MRFEIDPRAPAPPSEQLADQVRFAIAAGRLTVGQKLPSVRTLAADVLVNPNTVGRAYRALEREGTLESRRGSGMFVAEEAPVGCRAIRARVVSERVGRAVGEALSAGLKGDEVVDLVRAAIAAWQETMGEDS